MIHLIRDTALCWLLIVHGAAAAAGDASWAERVLRAQTPSQLRIEAARSEDEASQVCELEQKLRRPPLHCYRADLSVSDRHRFDRLCTQNIEALDASAAHLTLPKELSAVCRRAIETRILDLQYAGSEEIGSEASR